MTTAPLTGPLFSLVVATLGRPLELARLFESLCSQASSIEVEVIVVDQCQAFSAQPVCDEFCNRLNIKYITIPSRGISLARNMGVALARGTFLGFPDDDCHYPPNLLETLAQIFEQLGCDIVSGRYGEENGLIAPYFETTGSRITKWTVFRQASSITLFVRLRSVGVARFNNRLGLGTDLPAGEEIDFLLQLLRQGYVGVYCPEIVVFHRVWGRLQSTEGMAANAFVLALHGSQWAPLLLVKLIARVLRCLLLALYGGNRERQALMATVRGATLGLTEAARPR